MLARGETVHPVKSKGPKRIADRGRA